MNIGKYAILSLFNTDLMQDKQVFSSKGVLDFLSTTPKNRLVFDLNNSLEIDCIDIGYQLASALKNIENPSMLVGNVINRLILEHKSFDNSLGYVIAFKNIGILFEPALKINWGILLDSISKSITLVMCAPGVVKNDTYYFMNENSGISMDLKGMSYYVIE